MSSKRIWGEELWGKLLWDQTLWGKTLWGIGQDDNEEETLLIRLRDSNLLALSDKNGNKLFAADK